MPRSNEQQQQIWPSEQSKSRPVREFMDRVTPGPRFNGYLGRIALGMGSAGFALGLERLGDFMLHPDVKTLVVAVPLACTSAGLAWMGSHLLDKSTNQYAREAVAEGILASSSYTPPLQQETPPAEPTPIDTVNAVEATDSYQQGYGGEI